jgi:hypothetical protein
LLIILSYAARNELLNSNEVTEVSRFLLQTIKTTSQGQLAWPEKTKSAKFFKKWSEGEYETVKQHQPSTAKQDQKVSDTAPKKP